MGDISENEAKALAVEFLQKVRIEIDRAMPIVQLFYDPMHKGRVYTVSFHMEDLDRLVWIDAQSGRMLTYIEMNYAEHSMDSVPDEKLEEFVSDTLRIFVRAAVGDNAEMESMSYFDLADTNIESRSFPEMVACECLVHLGGGETASARLVFSLRKMSVDRFDIGAHAEEL